MNVVKASAGILLFALIVWASATRTSRVYHVPQPGAPITFGMCDFHNAVYIPGLAFRRGDNPYSAAYARAYPVNRELPPYSPLLLPPAAVLSLLPLHQADVTWFVFNLLLVLALAAVIIRHLDRPVSVASVFSLAAQFLPLGPATVIRYLANSPCAWCCRRWRRCVGLIRPWLSGVALAIASIKPTFGLPLGILLLFRRRWRAAFAGLLLSVLGAAAALGWLAMVSHEGLLASFQASHDARYRGGYDSGFVVDADRLSFAGSAASPARFQWPD